jgi:hypothetical protein
VGFNGWAPFEIGIFIVYLIPETYRATDGAKQSPTDQASLSVSGLKIVFLSMNYNGVQARDTGGLEKMFDDEYLGL